MINIDKICAILQKEYKSAKCTLNAGNNFQLLIMSRLSARCTDKCVNKISPLLFEKFPNPRAFMNADTSEIERIIEPCGLFKVKSRDLKCICSTLVNEFDSEIPYGLDNLQKLRGIGRKTANLIMSEVFHVQSIIVDTHVFRVSKRLGFHNEKSIIKVEGILKKYIDKNIWSSFCHRLVFHGRNSCTAKKPDCAHCCVYKYCRKII